MAVALFSMLGAQNLFDENSTWTMTRTGADGQLEVVRKDGRQIKVQKVTEQKLSGEGERLGVAYQLPGGRVVYVPEGEAPQGEPHK
jgi:hypothetical protein